MKHSRINYLSVIITLLTLLSLSFISVTALVQKMIYVKRDITTLPYPSNKEIHQLKWVFTSDSSLGNMSEADILDSEVHEFQVNRVNNNFDFSALKPRYGDITRLRYKDSILNLDGSHVGGEHYVAWNVERICSGRVGKRPYITAYVKFFNCAENAKEFYRVLTNTNKIRYDADRKDFDDLDRATSGSQFSNVDMLERAFINTLDTCPALP